jgi:hypothetical protein
MFFPTGVLSYWCKSLAHFCQPFPQSEHDVLPRVGNCRGVDKLLSSVTESLFRVFWVPPAICSSQFSCMCNQTVLRVCPVIFRLLIQMLHSWSEISCCGGESTCFVSSQYFANLSISSFRRPYMSRSWLP